MGRTFFALLVLGLTSSASAQDFLGKAKAFLVGRDTVLAVNQLQEALKAGQKSAEVNHLLGAIAYNRGKVGDAIGYLQTAVKLNDENADALVLLGQALLDTKDVPGALTQLRRAEKYGKKNPSVYAAYGRALLLSDSVDASIRALTLAKEYDAANPRIYELLGDAYLKQAVPPLAITNYQKVIELNPRNVEVRTKLAKVFEKMQNYNDAVREYDGIINIDTTKAEAFLAKGKILVRAKQYARAIPALRKYTTLQPKSVEGAALHTRALFGVESWGEAAKEAERAVKLDPTNTDIWRIQAQSLVKQKEFQKSLASFEELQKRNAFKAEDQSDYGMALVGVGREEDALKALLAAIAMDSTNCDPFYNLGSIYMKKQDYEKAATMFERKISCDPKSLGAYLNAANCHLALKNFGRARELLTRVLELKPDFLLGRFALARYFGLVDSLEKAKEQYDEVLQQIGTNTDKYKREAGEAYYQSGSYYFQTKQFPRAVESYRKAFGIGYENAPVHLAWGQAVLQTLDPGGVQDENKKKVAESVTHFRKTIQLDANNEQGHLWLAQALVFSRVEGDNEGNAKLKEEACTEYRKVLRLNPKNEDAKKGMERIGCPGAGK